jgi:hypothetical protein
MMIEEYFEEQAEATFNLEQKHIDAIGIANDYFGDKPKVKDKLYYFIECLLTDDEQSSHFLHPIFERNIEKLEKSHNYLESHGAVPIFNKEVA